MLSDEVIGMDAAEAGFVEDVGVANLLEALRTSGGAAAGDGGEGLLESQLGAEIDLFFERHESGAKRLFRKTEKLCPVCLNVFDRQK